MEYKTAETIEELDIRDELNAYHSVGHAAARHMFDMGGVDPEYRNVDFYILMIDNSEVEELEMFLNDVMHSAWLEFEGEPNTMLRIPSLETNSY